MKSLNTSSNINSKDSTATAIFIFFLAFYFIQILLTFVFHTPIIDYTVIFSAILIMFLLHLKFRFNRYVPLFLGLTFIFHALGFYRIIPYGNGQMAMLYGAPQLWYHYDWIVHVGGFFFATLTACILFYNPIRKCAKSYAFASLIFILAIIGIGSLIEITEYAGFNLVGYGEGFLLLGDGDFAVKESVWDNSSMDQLSNLIGAMTGMIIFLAVFDRNPRRYSS